MYKSSKDDQVRRIVKEELENYTDIIRSIMKDELDKKFDPLVLKAENLLNDSSRAETEKLLIEIDSPHTSELVIPLIHQEEQTLFLTKWIFQSLHCSPPIRFADFSVKQALSTVQQQQQKFPCAFYVVRCNTDRFVEKLDKENYSAIRNAVNNLQLIVIRPGLNYQQFTTCEIQSDRTIAYQVLFNPDNFSVPNFSVNLSFVDKIFKFVDGAFPNTFQRIQKTTPTSCIVQ